MANDAEHLLMCSFAFCRSSSVKRLFMYFAHFQIGFFAFCCWVLSFSVYSRYHSFVRYVLCTYFLPVFSLSFYFLTSGFHRAEVNFYESQLISCFFFNLEKKSRNVTRILPQCDGWKVHILNTFYSKVSIEIENCKCRDSGLETGLRRLTRAI